MCGGAPWIEASIVNLVVHIPCRVDEDSARALSLAQQAPSFTMKWVDDQKVAMGMFPSLPSGIDLAVQLVGESVRLSGAWASINSRRISSVTKLWQRSNCYRDSLNAPDRERYCLQETAFFNALVGCQGHRCPIPCQFLCTPCRHMLQDQPALEIDNRLAVATELAEIAWCPNLKVSGPGSQAGRPLLTIDPGSTKG